MPGRPFAYVMNKMDLLIEQGEPVPELAGGMPFAEAGTVQTSAKTGLNVRETFSDLSRLMIARGV